MKEELRKAAIAAVAGASILGAGGAEALKPEELHINASPSKVHEFIYKSSLAGGDRKEAYAVSYRINNTWYSAVAMGGLWGIPEPVVKGVLAKLDAASGRKEGDRVFVYTYHNHSAELIMSHLAGLFDRSEIAAPNELALGPSGADCLKNEKVFVGDLPQINIIIEPKITWVCGSHAESKRDNDISALRNNLGVATQKPNVNFDELVMVFEQEYKLISGVSVTHLSPNPTDDEIISAGRTVLGR